jgi:hypothetical protein
MSHNLLKEEGEEEGEVPIERARIFWLASIRK